VMHVPMHHIHLYQSILRNGMSVTQIQSVYVIVTLPMGRIVGECNGTVGFENLPPWKNVVIKLFPGNVSGLVLQQSVKHVPLEMR
jgi:hypothetical protein